MATVSAGRRSGGTSDTWNSGTTGRGRPEGIPPNRDPIVSMSNPMTITSAVPPTSAMMVPGTEGSLRRSTTMRASAVKPSSAASGVIVSR